MSKSEHAPSVIYVWLVPSEEVLEQPGSWRIRKWDTEPFPEGKAFAKSETSTSDGLDMKTLRRCVEVCLGLDRDGVEKRGQLGHVADGLDCAFALGRLAKPDMPRHIDAMQSFAKEIS